ncbi:hypothetical protein NDU88_005996 [Pleurodeles waltl]|uniref:Uncharacterized protein n=1 Tax=Pleurodeles waltl TaxID=8319 RepID=A0AAV7N7E4_PLEWA|nr:hypothetical protein NDU88_005996 [Pleurodeles waltl]
MEGAVRDGLRSVHIYLCGPRIFIRLAGRGLQAADSCPCCADGACDMRPCSHGAFDMCPPSGHAEHPWAKEGTGQITSKKLQPGTHPAQDQFGFQRKQPMCAGQEHDELHTFACICSATYKKHRDENYLAESFGRYMDYVRECASLDDE